MNFGCETEKALENFLKEPNGDNYNALFSAVSGTQNSESLYDAIKEILEIYNDNKDFFKGCLGVDLDEGESGFEGMSIGDIIKNMILHALEWSSQSYGYGQNGNTQSFYTFLDSMLQSLENAEGHLDQALQSEQTTTVMLEDESIVFDSIDIKVIKAMIEYARAMCLLLKSIDLEVSNWVVNGVNLKEKLSGGGSLSDSELYGLLQNNQNLLKFRGENGLSDFRYMFDQFVETFGEVITEFENMSEEEREGRNNNAFTIESDYDLCQAKAFKESLESIKDALSDGNKTLEVVWQVPSDSYPEYLNELNPFSSFVLAKYYKPVRNSITIYDVVSGRKSLRDVFLYSEDGPDWHDFYILDKDIGFNGKKIKCAKGMTVPEASITIDGDPSDWNSVPVAMWIDYSCTVKLARNGNTLYMYAFCSSGSVSDLRVSLIRLSPENGLYLVGGRIYGSEAGSLNCSDFSAEEDRCLTEETSKIEPFNLQNAVGFEASFEGSYDGLVSENYFNKFTAAVCYSWWCDYMEGFMKLLPNPEH